MLKSRGYSPNYALPTILLFAHSHVMSLSFNKLSEPVEDHTIFFIFYIHKCIVEELFGTLPTCHP
jgi:hypothetical protein